MFCVSSARGYLKQLLSAGCQSATCLAGVPKVAAAMKIIESRPTQQLHRMDWSVIFAHEPPLQHPKWRGTEAVKGEGQSRVQIVLADGKLSAWGRHIHIPEAWTRAERNDHAVRVSPQLLFCGLTAAR